jgi:hypothetical protein
VQRLTQLVLRTLLSKGRLSLAELHAACNAVARARAVPGGGPIHHAAAAVLRPRGGVPPMPPAGVSSGPRERPVVPLSEVKSGLLLLMQHNCVRAYLQPEEVRVTKILPAYHIYEADLCRTLLLLRCAHPHYSALLTRVVVRLLQVPVPAVALRA